MEPKCQYEISVVINAYLSFHDTSLQHFDNDCNYGLIQVNTQQALTHLQYNKPGRGVLVL